MTAALEFRAHAEIDAGDWEALVEASDEAWLWHRTAMIEARALQPGHRDLSFGIIDARGVLLAAMPLSLLTKRVYGGTAIIRRLFSLGGPAYAPGVPPEGRRPLVTALRDHLRGQLADFDAERFEARMAASVLARVNPLVPVGFQNLPGETWMVDLAPAPEEIRRRYARDTRYRLKLAAEAEFNLREAAGSRDLETYYALHLETCRRGGVAPDSFDYYRCIFERLSDRSRLLFLERGGRVLAAQHTIFDKGAALYLTGASGSERESADNRILFDDQILAARRLGCARYETGDAYLDGPNAKELGMSGFKRSFGAELASYFGGRIDSTRRKFRLMRAAHDFVYAWRAPV